MATILINLDTDNKLDLNLLRGLASGAFVEYAVDDRSVEYEPDDDELAEIHQEAQDNDGLLEQDRAPEDCDADEPPVSGQATGRAVSPYGFADPNREPGKPGEGRKRRTKAEMAEDEAYEAAQRNEEPEEQAEEEAEEQAEEQAPEAPMPAPAQQEEQPQVAPQPEQAPPVAPATSSPFNF